MVSSLPRVEAMVTTTPAIGCPHVLPTVVASVTVVELSAGADAVTGEMDDLVVDGLLSLANVTVGFAVKAVAFTVAETVRFPGTHEVMSK